VREPKDTFNRDLLYAGLILGAIIVVLLVAFLLSIDTDTSGLD
jgi:hypothetical protein